MAAQLGAGLTRYAPARAQSTTGTLRCFSQHPDNASARLSDEIGPHYFNHNPSWHPSSTRRQGTAHAEHRRHRAAYFHVTHYDYASRVDLAMHLLHLQPLSRADQQLEDFRLDIDPPAPATKPSLDYFGNPQHHLTLTTPHHALTVRAESCAPAGRRHAQPSASPVWESVGAAMRYRAG